MHVFMGQLHCLEKSKICSISLLLQQTAQVNTQCPVTSKLCGIFPLPETQVYNFTLEAFFNCLRSILRLGDKRTVMVLLRLYNRSMALSTTWQKGILMCLIRSYCLGIEHPCGTCGKILLPVGMLLSEIYGLLSVGRPLRLCNLQCNTQWSESSRTRNHTLLSHLRLPQLGRPDSRIYIPQEQGGPFTPPGIGFPLSRLLRLAGLRWRYSNPPPIWRFEV
jgi:hypothetical protein